MNNRGTWISLLSPFILLAAASLPASGQKPAPPAEVVHVLTALDHLTVLEFAEPVTMAAAGSSAYQIERHDTKVFIKPVKAGAATDLFVWTASRRYAYELEQGEAKNMNFAVDNPAPMPKQPTDSRQHIDEIADMMFTRAFLDAQRIDSSAVREAAHGITVRVEHVFRSRNTLYIHYSVRNLTDHPYRILAPAVFELTAIHPVVSPFSLERRQLNNEAVHKLGEISRRTLGVASAETGTQDLAAGAETQGIVAIREQLSAPSILQMIFGRDGTRPIEAMLGL